MTNKFSLEQYLAGRQPLQPERTALPTDAELEAAEAEYDRCVSEQNELSRHRAGTPLHYGRGWGWVLSIAAAVILTFLLWPERQEKTIEQPEQQVVIAEVQQPEKQDVIDVKKEKRHVPMIVQEPQVIVQSVPVRRTDENLTHQEVAVESEALRSDSFDYYLARLESEMEAMDDSVSLAQLEKLISADARLRQLVNRIVNGEVQQALNVAKPDSTTDYLNF